MTDEAKILIIEDDPAVRKMLAHALERPGWAIDAVETAEEALEVVGEASHDLVIVDKNLPAMSGVELAREVRERDREVAIVMITGYASVESAMAMIRYGIDAYLEKPFDDIGEIRDRVERSVERVRVLRGGGAEGTSAGATGEAGDRAGDRIASTVEGGGEAARRIAILCPDREAGDRLAEQLEAWGELVRLSASWEAVELFEDRPPTVLVADDGVEDPDIFELVAAVKAIDPGASCLVLLDEPSVKTISRLIELGVDSVLEKPVDARDLLKEMTHLA